MIRKYVKKLKSFSLSSGHFEFRRGRVSCGGNSIFPGRIAVFERFAFSAVISGNLRSRTSGISAIFDVFLGEHVHGFYLLRGDLLLLLSDFLRFDFGFRDWFVFFPRLFYLLFYYFNFIVFFSLFRSFIVFLL